MATKSTEWNLAVSKEDIYEKLTDFVIKQNDAKNRFLSANVKSQKLENALSVHNLEKDETPIIFYDDTLLGGGKDGFLITNKNVYAHEMFGESKKIAISELKTIKNLGSTILFDSISAPVSWVNQSEMVVFLKSILIKKPEAKKSAPAKKSEKSEPKTKSSLATEKKSAKTTKSKEVLEFKGFLSEKYRIGKGTAISKAVSILEEQGWTIKFPEEVSRKSYHHCNTTQNNKFLVSHFVCKI